MSCFIDLDDDIELARQMAKKPNTPERGRQWTQLAMAMELASLIAKDLDNEW